MMPGFTTTYAISVYHHCVVRESCSWRGVLDTTLCDSLSVTCGRSVGFFGFAVSSTNKTGRHDMNEILLKVVFNTITLRFFRKQIKEIANCTNNFLINVR